MNIDTKMHVSCFWCIQLRGSLGYAEADPQSDGPDLPTCQGERSASVP